MNQDISIKSMMLQVKYDAQIPPEMQGFIRKYLTMMYAIGFDSGRNYVYDKISYWKTPLIVRDKDGNRIAHFSTIKEASIATNTSYRTITYHLKSHKKTKNGLYFEKIV